MNARFGDFVKGFLHAFSANVIRLCISIILTLFLPKVLGVEEYSYWQLYLFYVTYTAYSSLGFCEGTYLKYGGKRYEELDKKIMASQFWTLAIYEICFGLVCGAVFTCFVGDADKRYLLCLALVSSFFDILRYLLQCVLQATSRIQDFAKVMTAERILFFLFLSILVGLGYRSFHSCIFSEILAARSSSTSLITAAWRPCTGATRKRRRFSTTSWTSPSSSPGPCGRRTAPS